MNSDWFVLLWIAVLGIDVTRKWYYMVLFVLAVVIIAGGWLWGG